MKRNISKKKISKAIVQQIDAQLYNTKPYGVEREIS
jgi:hypothetical protein